MKCHSGLDVWFTIVLSFVAIFLDQCSAVIYERHIIHVPLYVHVVHHHHVREPKGQKLQKVPNFRPLPAFPFPQQQHVQQQPQQQQPQQQQRPNQNPQQPAQFIEPRLPQHQQQQRGRNPNADAQWVHPAQLNQLNNAGNFQRGQRPNNAPQVNQLNNGGNFQRGQRPAPQAKLKKKPRPPTRGGGIQQFAPVRGSRPVGGPPIYYSTVYRQRPGAYKVPSTVRYVARHRTPAEDLSSHWYAYG